MKAKQNLSMIMKELISFSLPLILSGVMQQLYNWVDAFIVGNVDGDVIFVSHRLQRQRL